MIGLTTVRHRLERLGETDIKLIYWAAILLGVGCVFVYSSSALLAQRSALYGHETSYFIRKQILAGVIGTVIAVYAATCLSWKHIERLSGVFLAASVACLALVFVPGIGPDVAGVNRGVRGGGVSF